jgi:hypothetical protein
LFASQTITEKPPSSQTLFYYRVIFLPASVYSRRRPPAREASPSLRAALAYGLPLLFSLRVKKIKCGVGAEAPRKETES